MMHQHNAFPAEVGIASRVGLTRGVGFGPRLGSFAEAEMRYREERILLDLARRRRNSEVRASHSARSERFGHEVMSRWTTWLSSVPLLHRSSREPLNSSDCGN